MMYCAQQNIYFNYFFLYFNMVQALDAQKNLNAKLAVCKMADLWEKY